MRWLLNICVLIFSGTYSKSEQNWWEHAVFYQIYTKSFKDSNGDGIGDIQGIINKINHFKETGVDAILLSPIYKSSQGYDISDFKAIDEQFGTMEDFKELLTKAHSIDVKVIMDFIPNHTSNEHEWFINSENNKEGYEDYYVWRDETNNWINNLNNSAWTYSKERKQYYYHKYTSQQPDLNYRNEKVVEEIKKIMLFWLDLGVDGFCLNAIANLFEDADFRDEPASKMEDGFANLIHIYTENLPETLDMVNQFRLLVDNYRKTHGGDARVILTKVDADVENILKYYGAEDGLELRAHFSINYQLVKKLNVKSTAIDVVNAVNEWLELIPSIYPSNWFLGDYNHHRVASRFGPKNADGFNMLAALLPGIQITYSGEEIAQENGYVTFEQGKDPIACKTNETTYMEISRDFERTPFHWDKTKNAGFSEADETWLPVSERYLENNLEDQSDTDYQSHYRVYQELMQLRKQPTFIKGKLKLTAATNKVVAFSRTLEGHDTYVCLFNMGDTSEILNLTDIFGFSDVYFEVAVVSVDSQFKKRTIHNATTIKVNSHETVVLKMIAPGNLNWWKNAVIYQVFPRSFKDSDGDGTGDFKGITNNIQHFKNTGVNAIILSPIFKEPNCYHDYYISDYKEIDPVYGTMEDFQELVKTFHEIGIKVILEFVPNHSSNEHIWFELSENKSEGYENYYVWKDAVDGDEPNNWLSFDGNSIWTWSERRRQYYLHHFAPEQPDLNYRSDALVQEIKNTLRFWLDKGVDGFAMDSASLLFEDNEFKDEPLSGSYNDLDHIYTENQPETYHMIYEFRELLDDYTLHHGGDARILLTEVHTNIGKTMLYYGADDSSKLGAHFSFNYQLVLNEISTITDFVDAINTWMAYMPIGYTANWMLGDHNHHRVATRLGKNNIDGINILTALLPGVLLIYNGEEIGMEDGEVTIENVEDACRNQIDLNKYFARTPYHWDQTINAGFSNSTETWLPVSVKYLDTNLAVQSTDGVDSHYHVYQELVRLKQEEPFKSGKIKVIAISDNTLAYSRTLKGYDPYVIIYNLGTNSSDIVNLTSTFGFNCEKIEIILVSTNSSYNKGSLYAADNLVIQPHETIVARVIQKGNENWWKYATIYQVYPRSFKDSNGDGIGDLNGITDKLNHFVDAGVDAIWLTSVFKETDFEAGIIDFKTIDEEYGTMRDFEELLQEAHKLDIKVIIDFIPNHSSNRHEWFLLSQNKTAGYEDYYVWMDAVNGEEPNNWLSLYKNSAWEYSDVRKQYYLHQFSKEQPDLNYRSETVVREIKDIMLFWLQKGVDGFGIDTISYLFEHKDFENEPLSGEDVNENDYAYLNHIYTKDQPETYSMLYKFREWMDNYTQYHGGDSKILISVANTDLEKTLLYYGTDDGLTLGAHLALNLQFVTKLEKDFTADNLVEIINNGLPLQYTPNWLLGNHNYHRAATRFGSENVDGFNMLIALLPGVQITYNGEEIGMEDGSVTLEEGVDVGDCDNEVCYNEFSRDFERTPYHWNKNKNAGFSDSEKTWLPVSKKYLKTNLEDQSIEGVESHYQVYRDLVELRRNEAFVTGKLQVKAVSDCVLVFCRYLLNGDAYVYVFNFGKEKAAINLLDVVDLGFSVQILITSVGATLDLWSIYNTTDLYLDGHESFVGIFTNENPNGTTTETVTEATTIITEATTSPSTSEPEVNSFGSHPFLNPLLSLILLFNVNLY